MTAPFKLERLKGKQLDEQIARREEGIIERLNDIDDALAATAAALPLPVRRSVFSQTLRTTATGVSGVPTPQLVRALRFFADRRRAVRVGIWPLDAGARGLDAVVGRLNEVQHKFVFFSLCAPIPAGLVSRRELVCKLYRQRYGRLPRADEREPHLLADDFLPLAEITRDEVGVHRMFGVTKQLVGDMSKRAMSLGYTTVSRGACSLVSTYYLEGIAKEAKRPEAPLIAWHILSQILVDLDKPLVYHPDRGCLFDDNEEDMARLSQALATACVEVRCLRLISARHRAAVRPMATALAEMWRGDSDDGRAPERKTQAAKKRTTSSRRGAGAAAGPA